MCGACGGTLAAPPWEVLAHGGTRRDILQRAREAEELARGRLRVRPFGPAGYQVTSRTGRTEIHPSLDGLVRQLVHQFPGLHHRIDKDTAGPVAAAVLGTVE